MEVLHRHLEQFNTAPFLFIGSGISRRYINSDDWKSLLTSFSEATGKPFQYYMTKTNGKLDSIASMIAEEFNEIWWKNDEYSDSRDNFKDMVQDKSSAMKIEICNNLNALLDEFIGKMQDNSEISSLKNVTIDGVITTNYDKLIETLFPDFKVYIGQEQLLFSSSHGIGEIYKIHGCSSDPNSLIITAEDYRDFNDKNAYLASKLITIFVEHPIVFLGYSLGDENITLLLENICRCLSAGNIEKLRNRLIFVEYRRGLQEPIMESSTIKLSNNILLPVYRIFADSFLPIYSAISKLNRKFPAKLLRQLKDHVYNLILTTDTQKTLYVKNFDSDKDDINDCDIVFGVGAINAIESIGLRGLSRDDLVRDVLFDDKNYPANGVVSEALPGIFVNAMKYCPMFKYLRNAGYIDENHELISGLSLPEKVVDHMKSSHSDFIFAGTKKNRARKIQSKFTSFKNYTQSTEPEDAIANIPGFEFSFVNLDELKEFLIKNFHLSTGIHSSNYHKLVCLFDYRKYRIQR